MLKAVSLKRIANLILTGTVEGGVFDVAGWGIPFVYLSSGSVAANGAISAITALPNAYPAAFCYFPANALATTIAAGWHYCTFSTTTAGTAYLNTYTSGEPTIPTSLTPVTDGKGAFTSGTAEVAAIDITIPANQLGPGGSIIHHYAAPANTGGGAKTYRIHYSAIAGTVVVQQAPTTAGAGEIGYIVNRGTTNKQVSSVIQAITADTIVNAYLAVDTTAATTLVYSMQKAAAAENAVIECGYVHTIKRS